METLVLYDRHMKAVTKKNLSILTILIKYPDGKEEYVDWFQFQCDTCKRVKLFEDSFKSSFKSAGLKVPKIPKCDFCHVKLPETSDDRMIKIQDIINKLEKDGYHVPPSQLSLFMRYKIKQLILQK